MQEVAIVGIVFTFIFLIVLVQTMGKQNKIKFKEKDTEESRIIQELHHQLLDMEKRVEVLEELLYEKKDSSVNQDNKGV